MKPKEPVFPKSNERLSRKARLLIALWAAGLLAVYALIGAEGVNCLRGHRAETERMRQAWLTSRTVKIGETLPGVVQNSTASPVTVSVVVNQMGEFVLQKSTWELSFDVIFRWKDASIDPGETFRIGNGEILRRSREISCVENGEHYERYNVRARIEQAFDPSRIPFSDAGLVVLIEDPVHDVRSLRYEVGGAGIRINPILSNLALKITKTYAGVKYSTYPRADDRPWASPSEVHSQFVFAMLARMPSREAYLKMFQALFASVGIALLALFINPEHRDPRFALGVGAFFAAVGNNIFLATQLPPSGRMSLTVFVNMVGLLTIFLSLVQSVISLHLFHEMGEHRLSLFFDRVSVGVLAIGYVVVNLLLPYAAMP